MSDKRRGMTASILEDKLIGNCSANGVSARYRAVCVTGIRTATGHDRPAEISAVRRGLRHLDNSMRLFTPDAKYVEVKLVVRHLFGAGVYVHAEPIEGNGAWAMAGGTYITTCDSRWNDMLRAIYGAEDDPGYQVGPVPLHDRYEGR